MTKFLLILVLVITIPRWAQTLAQVDTFAVAGIPVTAIGEGIVLELACYFLIQAHGAAHEENQRYKADWEAHEDRMQEQGKKNRKPRKDPELSGSGQLMVLYYVLLALTVVSQWPFLMGTLTGQPVTELIGTRAQWGYTLFLVIAPEVVTFALARAAHYGRICARRQKARAKDGRDVQEAQGLWAFLGAQVRSVQNLFSLVQEPSKLDRDVDKNVDRPEQPDSNVSKLRPGKPDVNWWRSKYGQMNGERDQVTPEYVQELVLAEWEVVPSRTTLYNWSDECVQSVDSRNGRGVGVIQKEGG